MKNEVATLSNDINIITAEINAYQRVAGEAIFEIGRRLKHVKENDLAHGEFGKWLDSIGMNDRVARMMMKVASELEGERSTYSEIGLNALYHIATMPEEAREIPHIIPSTGETKTVDEMTVRELREVKKALKEAEQSALQAETARRQAEERALEAEEKAERYEQLFGDAGNYDTNTTKVTNGDAITYAVYSFQEDTRTFIEKYAYLTNFAREFDGMIDEGKDEYLKAIDSTMSFLGKLKRMLTEQDAIIIEQ